LPCRISIDKEGRALKATAGRISRERLIRLAAALGTSIAGASALAACGDNSIGRSSNGTANGDKITARASGGKAPVGSREIAQVSKVPAGSAVTFEDSGSPAVLVHLQNGKFAAYSAVCTHQGCTVAYQNGRLACPCHGSVFDPSKGGAVLYGPAPAPLPRIPVKVQNGEIYRT
jgi:cytochrome b6-f complex iron-sulfur subunit